MTEHVEPSTSTDPPPASSSISNKFDLNQYLICSNHPLSESNSAVGNFHLDNRDQQQQLVYPSLACATNGNANQMLKYAKYPIKSQDILSGGPLDANILNHSPGSSTSAVAANNSLYFPKDLDQVACSVSATTSSSVSQTVNSGVARSNSNSGSIGIASVNTATTVATTMTTATSPCKSQVSPITFEDFEGELNNNNNQQYCHEQAVICWSSDKIHFLDPNLIQEEGTEQQTQEDDGGAVAGQPDGAGYDYGDGNNDYTYRLIAFGSSPPPAQLVSAHHHLVALQRTSSDTLTAHDSESSQVVAVTGGTAAAVEMDIKQSSQLLEYHSTSSNIFLDYLKSEEELEHLSEMKEKMGLQPAFEYKGVYSTGGKTGDQPEQQLEKRIPSRRHTLLDLPSSPIVTTKKEKQEESVCKEELKEEQYFKSPSPAPSFEEDIMFKRRFKKSGELRKNALMIHPITLRFSDRKDEFTQCMEKFIAAKPPPLQQARGCGRTHSSTTNGRPAINPNAATEIYEIGPKVLPKPFTEAFDALRTSKFLPLLELMADPEYQLGHGQTTNYNLKTKNKVRCPNRPNSQGNLGPFRVHNEKHHKHKMSHTATSSSGSSYSSASGESLKKKKGSRTSPRGSAAEPIESSSKEMEFKNDRYYSRLNIYELSKILNLHQYSIQLTKLIEVNILEIFGNYCDFQLGYQTWIRDTTKQKRKELIEQLYSYTVEFYPEINPFKLEVIIRRGSYSLMQTRLRRERRLKQRSREFT
ncbi:hypothetical protein Cantr_10760 [Candida viswanathii]|uniref:Uncharacterized protein n=1 Tax=Candida viswanathii TaxID=5486 RepID=A0A367YE45_9ASCO|nr:hypothetical protein Cantr_10760 [Candida viswanathii]